MKFDSKKPEKRWSAYSKVYREAPNPKDDFCAVMTCSQADKNCPYISGCSLRVSVPFEDPKDADGTPEEEATYDERCQQICREMLYLFFPSRRLTQEPPTATPFLSEESANRDVKMVRFLFRWSWSDDSRAARLRRLHKTR